MLGGVKITETTRKHAAEMLGSSLRLELHGREGDRVHGWLSLNPRASCF